MSPGQLARRLLGSHFHIAGEAYRRVFVDMDKVTDAMVGHIPQGAHVLDVGGGDGYVADLLMAKRPDIRITLIDIATSIGSFIRREHLERVTLRPGTDVAQVEGRFDAMVVTDVVHHVHPTERPAFFSAIAEAAARTGCTRVLVKDIEPGNLRALLALWGDLYITCDRNVELLPAEKVQIPGFERVEASMPDFPNYLLAFGDRRAA